MCGSKVIVHHFLECRHFLVCFHNNDKTDVVHHVMKRNNINFQYSSTSDLLQFPLYPVITLVFVSLGGNKDFYVLK